MAAFDFPNNPAVGDQVGGAGGITYVWDGVKWSNGTVIPVGGGEAQTPWLSNIDGAGHELVNTYRIGIGISSPQTALHCYSTVNDGADITVHTTGDGAFIAVQNGVGSYKGLQGKAGDGSMDFAIGHWGMSGRGMNFISGNAEAMRIDAAARVGIGTASPGALLHLYQAAASGYQLELSSGSPWINWGIAISSSNGYFLLDEIGVATRISIAPGSGYLGINNPTPAYPLDVNGQMRLRTGGGMAGIWYDSNWAATRWFVGSDPGADTFRIYGPPGNIFNVHAGGSVGIMVGAQNQQDALTIQGMGPGGLANLRLVYGAYGFFFRNDGATLYMMATNVNDPYGGWKSPFPVQIDLATCTVGIGVGSNAGYSLTVGSIYSQSTSFFGGVTGMGWGPDGSYYLNCASAHFGSIVLTGGGNVNVTQGGSFMIDSVPGYWGSWSVSTAGGYKSFNFSGGILISVT